MALQIQLIHLPLGMYNNEKQLGCFWLCSSEQREEIFKCSGEQHEEMFKQIWFIL